MPKTWQTDEVIRQLDEADLDELHDIVRSGGSEALQEWVREGSAPKSLYDAVMRFTKAPDSSFNPVDWDAVVDWIRTEAGDDDDVENDEDE
jgi:hypothetical protein